MAYSYVVCAVIRIQINFPKLLPFYEKERIL
jgi:hypothetical protein